MTTIKQYDIWIADLEPQRGTETGKVRPVLIIQTDHLNRLHPSTIICPITTKVQKDSEILRVHIPKNKAGLKEDSDIMIDQIRSIDNRRLIKRVGLIHQDLVEKVEENIKIVLNLE
jgi:mRNA interferase MazF